MSLQFPFQLALLSGFIIKLTSLSSEKLQGLYEKLTKLQTICWPLNQKILLGTNYLITPGVFYYTTQKQEGYLYSLSFESIL